MKIDLSGKVALVTGGSGELGRVMARTLASCGADVAVHYHRSEDQARRVQDDIVAMGRRAATVQADITQRDDVFAMRDRVQSLLARRTSSSTMP